LERCGRVHHIFSIVHLDFGFDDKIKDYIAEHPNASVVNIGAGLDTTFYRVDNGLLQWYDLDLPAVIHIRKQLLLEPDRVTCIAKSFLDQSWCKDVDTENGVFMIAGGLLRYFEESQVKKFFSMLADNFPGGEIVFDVESKLDSDFRAFSNWRLVKWALEDANEIMKWDSRITVIDQFPLYRNIPRDPSLSIEIRQFMDYSDKSGRVNILHLRV
jgi:O-methyltransferase involved in polyketide biosynthesis